MRQDILDEVQVITNIEGTQRETITAVGQLIQNQHIREEAVK